MKRVLFINHTNDVFGAETVLLNILKDCFNKEDLNSIYVIEPKYKNVSKSKFRKAVMDIGVKNIISLPYKNIGGGWMRMFFVFIYNLYATIRLFFYIKHHNIDIIYSNTSVSCLGVFLSKITKKKHIWHIHEPLSAYYISQNLYFLYKLLISYSYNLFIFISKQQKEEWEKQFSGLTRNSIVVYNPIKLCMVNKERKNILRYGFIGSLAKRKNVKSLLLAFESPLFNNGESYKLIITDNLGDDRNNIHNMVDQNEYLKENVEFVDGQNINDIYSKIDVLILPSYSETWGLVALEAMSVGIATIITKNTGLIDLFKNEIETIYIDPNNVLSIIDAMKKMKDEEFRIQIIKSAKKKIEYLNFNQTFTETFRSLFI